MMTHRVNQYTRVSWTTFPDHARPYHVRVEAYVPSRQWWETVRWEQFASRDERDARLRELERGFSEGRYAVFYEEPSYPWFALVEQRSGDIWLFRVLGTTSGTRFFVRRHRAWALPFEERPAYVQNAPAEAEA